MFGICNLNTIPVRKEKSSKSELTTQLIYGEIYKVLKNIKSGIKLKLLMTITKAGLIFTQFFEISKDTFDNILNTKPILLQEISKEIETLDGKMLLSIGAKISSTNALNHNLNKPYNQKQTTITKTAMKYLNTPYLWGGKNSQWNRLFRIFSDGI